MSDLIWLYIWIGVKAYLGAGLFIALAISYYVSRSEGKDVYALREFIFTVIFHPIVVYFLIKELDQWNSN
jgi:hypothetical protein